MSIVFFNNITNPIGYTKDIDWSTLVSSFDFREDKDGALYTAAIYADDNPRRSNDMVKAISAVVIDFDNEGNPDKPTTPSHLEGLSGYEYHFHSTHSNFVVKNGHSAPRWRLIIPLDEPATPEEWPEVWQGTYDLFKRDPNIDSSCKAMSRAYYCPSSINSDRIFSGSNQGKRVSKDWLKSKRIIEKETYNNSASVEFYGATHTDIVDALNYISPDISHEDWVSVGMALKSELGNSGFLIWDNWSRGSSKYPRKGQPSTSQKWNSFKSTGITIATLFKFAKDGGWVYQPHREEEYENVVIFEGGNLKPIHTDNKIAPVLLDAPGLVGEIATWITKTAFRPQPELSLAASVAAVGVIYGHVYRTETDLRSNMLTLGIGPSGCGKDHPRKCIDRLLELSGGSHLIGGNDVSSGTALIRGLEKSNGVRLYQMDEIGRTLGGLTSSSSASFQSEILTNIMQLFSYANGIFRSKEFSDNKEKPRVDIVEPCLCIHGSTVPSRFYNAISSAEAADGFLSRWLIFETHVRTPEENYHSGSTEPPSQLVDKVRDVINSRKASGIDEVFKPRMKTIPFTASARKMFDDYGKFCDQKGDEEFEKMTGLDALWTRAREHAYKLALVAHEGDSINANVSKWAIDLVTFMVNKNIKFLSENLADTKQEKYSNNILSIIRKANAWVGKQEIVKCSRSLNAKARNDILQDLIDAGLIVMREVKEDNAKRPRQEFAIK